MRIEALDNDHSEVPPNKRNPMSRHFLALRSFHRLFPRSPTQKQCLNSHSCLRLGAGWSKQDALFSHRAMGACHSVSGWENFLARACVLTKRESDAPLPHPNHV